MRRTPAICRYENGNDPANQGLDSHHREVVDLVAAAGDLFQRAKIAEIEKLVKKARGIKEDDHRYFQEVIILSDNLIHVSPLGFSAMFVSEPKRTRI